MGFFDWFKREGKEGERGKEEESESKLEGKQVFEKRRIEEKKPMGITEIVPTNTVFGKAKKSTTCLRDDNKKEDLIFNGITELPKCVESIIPYVNENIVEGVFRVNIDKWESTAAIVTDKSGKSHINKTLKIPVIEFVPYYLITPEEKKEMEKIIEYARANGKNFEIPKVAAIEKMVVQEKLYKARVMHKGAKVRDDISLIEFGERIREVFRPANGNSKYILGVQNRNDPNRIDNFVLMEFSKEGVQDPEHLLKVENLIDMDAMFAGMDRTHLIIMTQKGIVIEYDRFVGIIMPIAKLGN